MYHRWMLHAQLSYGAGCVTGGTYTIIQTIEPFYSEAYKLQPRRERINLDTFVNLLMF